MTVVGVTSQLSAWLHGGVWRCGDAVVHSVRLSLQPLLERYFARQQTTQLPSTSSNLTKLGRLSSERQLHSVASKASYGCGVI